jgi:hypothetical protein
MTRESQDPGEESEIRIEQYEQQYLLLLCMRTHALSDRESSVHLRNPISSHRCADLRMIFDCKSKNLPRRLRLEGSDGLVLPVLWTKNRRTSFAPFSAKQCHLGNSDLSRMGQSTY